MKIDSGLNPIIFLYLFLVVSGIYAIVVSLIQLKNLRDNPSQGAAFETKWFKFNAPAGFVYGLVSILIVIVLVKFADLSEYRITIASLELKNETLQKENEFFKTTVSTLKDSNNVFRIVVDSIEPKSIFGGKVIILYKHQAFSDSELIFKGVVGISSIKDGTFSGNSIKFKKGDKFYLKINSNETWGINVLNEMGKVTLEFYKIS